MKSALKASWAMTSALVVLAACTESTVGPVSPQVRDRGSISHLTEFFFIKIPDDDFKETDDNANGTVCAKDTPSGGIVLLDDNAATPSQPCPPAFLSYGKGASVPIGVIKEGDDNRNGKVCVKKTANGGLIIRDDNLETPSQPCPPAFAVVGAVKDPTPKVDERDVVLADVNENGYVCLRQTMTGDFLVKDDNLATPSQPCAPAYLYYQYGFVRQPPEKSTDGA